MRKRSCAPLQTLNYPECPKIPQKRRIRKCPINVGVSTDFPREKLDRRVSVAPMMDWTDGQNSKSQTAADWCLEGVRLFAQRELKGTAKNPGPNGSTFSPSYSTAPQ